MEDFSMKDIDRLRILENVQEGKIKQIKAAELLRVTDRQIRNWLTILKKDGPQGLISKKRGKSSNRKINPHTKSTVLRLIRENYNDFGSTLIAEKLTECHDIKISKETIRKWMIETHIWVPHIKPKKRHLLRKRREYLGEMLQGDGSPDDWFENHNPCSFMYFIDDATNIITAARFEENESLKGYFELLRMQITSYGRPFSIYTDRFSVFETSCDKSNLTQFRRALESLDIEWIGANSPQAKGRIERCNRTLQDRLKKEMRLRGIKTIEEGNRFLEEYIPIFNSKFSKKPAKSEDLHRPLEQGIDLSRTLSKYEERTLTKDLTFQFHNTHYKIIEPTKGCHPGKKLEIRTNKKGEIRVFSEDKELNCKKMEGIYEKESKIIPLWPDKHTRTPSKDHPWRYFNEKRQKHGFLNLS